MSYTALYRKFRPTTFDEVRGQEHIVTTLRNQLQSDRVGHAYLFCGSRGTGKTSVAKIFARAVNCEEPGHGGPCNRCETCRSILDGSSTNVIEIDAASNNGVDNIREIRDEVAYRPTRGRYKVYIIDEAHMLSPGAFNALLKTLEEPPEHVIFILATTESGKIPVTILSRCQRYDFHRITSDEIADRVSELLEKEGVEAEDKAVRYIARSADGSLRDALSLLEQCVSYQAGETLTYDRALAALGTPDRSVFRAMLRALIAGDAAASVRGLDQLAQKGKEMSQFVTDFTWYLRDLLLLQSSPEMEDIVEATSEEMKLLHEDASAVEASALMRCIRALSELSGVLRTSAQRRVLVETALIRLCRPESGTDNEALLERVRRLEEKIENGNFAPRAREEDVYAREEPADAWASREEPAPGFAPAQPAPEEPAPAQPSAQPASAQPSAPPAKAAPADLQKAREQWRAIIADMDVSQRNYLEQSVPKFDPESGDNVLYVETREELHRMMLGRPEVVARMEEIIRERVGREVKVEVVLADQANSALSEISIQEMFAGRINMPIEEYTED